MFLKLPWKMKINDRSYLFFLKVVQKTFVAHIWSLSCSVHGKSARMKVDSASWLKPFPPYSAKPLLPAMELARHKLISFANMVT